MNSYIAHKYIQIYVYLYKDIHVSQTWTCIHSLIHDYLNICIHICMYALTSLYIQTCACMVIYRYKHSCLPTCIKHIHHILIQLYIKTCIQIHVCLCQTDMILVFLDFLVSINLKVRISTLMSQHFFISWEKRQQVFLFKFISISGFCVQWIVSLDSVAEWAV